MTKTTIEQTPARRSTVDCYVARDKAGGLIGIYEKEPTELLVKETDAKDKKTYFSHPSMLIALPYETFHRLFKVDVKEGECLMVSLKLVLVEME